MTLKKLKKELARCFGGFLSAALSILCERWCDDDAMSHGRFFRCGSSNEFGEGQRSDEGRVDGAVDARLEEKVDDTGLMASTLTTESGSLPNLALYCSLGIQGTTIAECILSDCIMQCSQFDEPFPPSYLSDWLIIIINHSVEGTRGRWRRR